MNDKEMRGTPTSRVSVTVPMSEDMKARITKAAGKEELSTVRYIRKAVRLQMERDNHWSIPGPQKGTA
jgi:hypothetical protein